MTPQEKLHAVETAIRKAIPRLMEPTGGVWVKRILKPGMMPSADTRPLKLIDYGDKNSFLAIRMDGTLPPKPTKIFKDEVGDGYEIIAYDILLSDVLEWLGLLQEDNEDILHFSLRDKEVRIDLDNNLIREVYQFKINLSKPRLADQSEELWDFLYNLIEQ